MSEELELAGKPEQDTGVFVRLDGSYLLVRRGNSGPHWALFPAWPEPELE